MGNSLPRRVQSTLSLVTQAYWVSVWKVTLTLYFTSLGPHGVVQLVALTPPLFTVLCSLQASIARHALLVKGDWKVSLLEINQTLRRRRSLVLLNWNLGMWRELGDHEVLLKLPREC